MYLSKMDLEALLKVSRGNYLYCVVCINSVCGVCGLVGVGVDVYILMGEFVTCVCRNACRFVYPIFLVPVSMCC